MFNGRIKVPAPSNEPVYDYAPGSSRRTALQAKLAAMQAQQIEVPLIIGGQEIRTGDTVEMRCPHDHSTLLGIYHKAGEEQVRLAIEKAREAWRMWSEMPWQARASIFLRMAELLAGPWRDTLNAATMLGQSKNVFQAEIDSACELIDFWRFNTYYMMQLYDEQPDSAKGMWNYVEYRPLEGFVLAVTPFNFTSIAGNLPTSPVLMGNVALWKPASSAVYPAYYLMQLFKAAGIPDGVINFIPGPGSLVGPLIVQDPDLAGIHFTGSTAVFQDMWKTVGTNIHNYKSYPRIVGETGGKDFIFVHVSADVEETATALVRGAFEYQGQKCSAASRAYIPQSFWPGLKEKLRGMLDEIKMGKVDDFSNFVNAVIDRQAFKSITAYIDEAKESPDAEIVFGGHYDDREGYFIEPTVIEAKSPDYRSMVEEIFGPVLTIYIYPDNAYEKHLEICDQTGTYALTGAIMAHDRQAINMALQKLRHCAGNFYINDKPTGAVVGQQPFGGSRASGTNDKAGSKANLMRWVSTRTIKETLLPPRDYKYPFMAQT